MHLNLLIIKKSGFTLIEVLVATLLLGIMGTLLMRALNSSVRIKDNVENISTQHQLINQAMNRMAREISMAYLSKHMNISEPAFVTQFKGRKNKLFFSAFGNVVRQKDAKQSDQQVLGFFVGTDRNGNSALMRRHHANLNLNVEEGGTTQVLCPNVTSLEFAYFDEKLEKWEESWFADPTSFAQLEAQGVDKDKLGSSDNLAKPWRLPRYVRFSIKVDIDGVEQGFVSQTEIPVQEPLDLN